MLTSRDRAVIFGALLWMADKLQSDQGANMPVASGRHWERWRSIKLRIGMSKTTGDGCVSVEAVHCVGLCITGKVVVVDPAPLAGMALT